MASRLFYIHLPPPSLGTTGKNCEDFQVPECHENTRFSGNADPEAGVCVCVCGFEIHKISKS